MCQGKVLAYTRASGTVILELWTLGFLANWLFLSLVDSALLRKVATFFFIPFDMTSQSRSSWRYLTKWQLSFSFALGLRLEQPCICSALGCGQTLPGENKCMPPSLLPRTETCTCIKLALTRWFSDMSRRLENETGNKISFSLTVVMAGSAHLYEVSSCRSVAKAEECRKLFSVKVSLSNEKMRFLDLSTTLRGVVICWAGISALVE